MIGSVAPSFENTLCKAAREPRITRVKAIRRPAPILWVLAALASAGTVAAAVENLTPGDANVRAVGGGRFAVGRVVLDKNTRSVSFPGTVNLRDVTVEYGVVHVTGKTHESIFNTEARPQDVHLAMLLLGAKPEMTNRFGADGKAMARGERVTIDVTWTNATGAVHYAMEDLVLNRGTTNSLPPGDWIYNGSNLSEGAFTAQRDGSIVSIHIDPDALINNPRPGREDDDLHQPFAARLPEVGAPVAITIRFKRHPLIP
jgi:hypothetical protein